MHSPTPDYGPPPAKPTVTRAIVSRSNDLARGITRKVINASKSDGAHESGLTALIWNQVLSYGTDAMITVALAGTVFFGASPHAQRGNVLLYLLVTMAPFAVVAPIIGPALDRLQHGRRWAMAGTAIGRAVLAAIMAEHPTELLVLYPCALGSLVLSKAYSVIRAAAAPRLVPTGMTLVEANARLSIFGLGSALAGGAFIGIVIKATDSYAVGLWVTAFAFCVCAFFALRLPKHIDAAAPLPRTGPRPPRPAFKLRVPPLSRIGTWASRGLAPTVITALRGESTMRFLSGFLAIFLAFHIETTSHGVDAALALGGVVVGAGAGNFVGTGVGTRLRLAHPEVVIMICGATAAVTCLLTAILFTIPFAVFGMFASSSTNSLAKIALDAVVQRDVPESLRSSAFARSETFLQLAWVLGATIAVLMPSDNGSLGFWVAGAAVGGLTTLILMRNRVMQRAARAPRGGLAPGQPSP
jgi:Major Facilitator Superfamily